MKKQMLRFLTVSALLALPALAQPAPPPPGGPGMVPPPSALNYGYRELERAQRELSRAQYLASIVGPAPLKREADALLQQAQRDYQAQAYFRASERAKAAASIYEALRFLEVAPGPAASAYPAYPGGRGRKAYEAPYRAQEAIARVEYEASYYQVNQPLVNQLLGEAKRLLAAGADLARAEAAHRLARAAHHLIRAERGF
jgi:hypothetical protein